VRAYNDLPSCPNIGRVGYSEDDASERGQSSSATLYSRNNYEIVEAVNDSKVQDQVSGSSSDGINCLAFSHVTKHDETSFQGF